MSRSRASRASLPSTTIIHEQSPNTVSTTENIGRETKRRRFVPPPPTSTNFAEDEQSLHTISIPSRYSLRQRKEPNGSIQGSPSQSIKSEHNAIDVKAEVDQAYTPSSSPVKKKVKAEPKDPFSTSPRKISAKPIKVDLDESEARAAPKRWKEQLEVLTKQRKRIVAPVDTMGCQENGKDEKRKDGVLPDESPEDKAKRERFTILVSLMLSSQTKDPVTADAVHNLQRNLKGGLSLSSILMASQDDISSNINKVGFWRRKTGYIQSAAQIIRDDFNGDIPKTIDELCSLPGVGPKMGFLALQSAWKINIGIGVDVHVHRVANRLKWVNSNDPEGTRLQLQSWLPKELHPTINKTLVGFGQVVCQPVGPRCDLCALGAARFCPSFRKVDPKSIASRVKVEFLPETAADESDGAAAIKLEGPDGQGALLVNSEEVQEAKQTIGDGLQVKIEPDRLEW